MTPTILTLSWQIQTALASGYAAYLLGYMGIRWAHKTIDTAFCTLVFSLVASAVLFIMQHQHPIIAAASAFLATCLAAVLWRRLIRKWLFWALRKCDVTWSNDDPSALDTLSSNARFRITQVSVELDDGTWLESRDASQFSDAPFNPVILGPNGDIALYLTHETRKGETARQLTSVRNSYYGDRITYIPAQRVRQITIRHKKISRSSQAAEAEQHSE
jgi:hypothetical protein